MPRKGEYEKWIKGEGLKKIIEWVKSGLDDKQIAEDKIHIHKSTLYDWFNRFPEFADAYKKAKEIPEAAVENALYNTAIGRTYYEEVRIIKNKNGETIRTIHTKRKIPPNPTAAMCWLKHKNPAKWGDW